MKASTIDCSAAVAAQEKSERLTWWKTAFKKFHAFFTDPFESDWEKATGFKWHEWQSGGTK